MISKERDDFVWSYKIQHIFWWEKKKLITVYLVLVDGGAAVTSTDLDSDESSSIASTYQLQVSSKPRIVAIKEAILN